MPYRFTGSFNGLKHTEDFEAGTVDPRVRTCPRCGFFLNKWEVDWDLRRKPEGGPMVSFTVDGFHIASPSFRRRYEEEGFHGLTFRPLSCSYFEIRPTRTVRMVVTDLPFEVYGASKPFPMFAAVAANRELFVSCKLEPRCPECEEWRAILGGGAMVIAADEPPVGKSEIVGTDIHLFDKSMRSFLLIAGNGVKAANQRKKMGGVSLFHEVIHARQEALDNTDAMARHTAAQLQLRSARRAVEDAAETIRRHEERAANKARVLEERAAFKARCLQAE